MSKKKKTESTPVEGATTDQVTPEATPEGAQAAPAQEEVIGTTQKLFEDLMPKPEGEEDPPPAAAQEGTQQVTATEAPPEEAKEKEAPPESKTALPERLSVEDFGDVMVKVKVDGVETEKPFKDVVKNYQLESHLTKKGQKLAESLKEIEELKAKIAAQPPSVETSSVDDLYLDDDAAVLKAVAPLQAKIEKLEAQLANAAPALGDIQYQSDIKVLDSKLKEQGLTDFMEYLPKIEEHVFSLPIEEQAKASTFEFYENQYKTLKLLNPIKPTETTPPAGKAPSVDTRPIPPVAPIESGGSTPSGANIDQATFQKDLEAAKASGDFVTLLQKMGY